MAPPADPWRTLGLAPGSSADDVRRAYRRLAKANHPDAAGEQALPRFLAIQAAYEQLAGGRIRRRPGARPASGQPPADPAREPWRADPDRARASGRADRRRPGARPASGSTGSGAPGAQSAGAPPTEDERTRRTGGSTGSPRDAAGAGSSEEPRGRRGGRGRTKKATPYSTSYDAAEDEPFEPGWSGATWYGASSGTYWTINPKEYADPRKHGPEYQRRARRSRQGWILDDDPGAEPEEAPGAAAGPAERPADRSGPSSRRADRTWTDARGVPEDDGRAGEPAPDPASASTAGMAATEPPSTSAQRWPRVRAPRTLSGRLVAAILAWPFLGGLLSFSVQESSGCGRFAASCPALSAPGTLAALVVILGVLVAVPRLAAWLATGTIAAFAAGAATAVALSAGGGTALPDVSTTILGAVVLVAYVVGVIYAVAVERLGGQSRRVP